MALLVLVLLLLVLVLLVLLLLVLVLLVLVLLWLSVVSCQLANLARSTDVEVNPAAGHTLCVSNGGKVGLAPERSLQPYPTAICFPCSSVGKYGRVSAIPSGAKICSVT
jgi:hypothetical protein